MKKFLSLLLAIIMVIGMFPMTAFAEETNIPEETVIVDEAETSDEVEVSEEAEIPDETEVSDEADVSDETAVTDGNLDLEPVSVSDEANTLGEDGDTEEYYEVTVKAAPSGAEIKFYSGSDAETEITEGITDNGIVNGYHQYTFVAEEGMYSYRAWEGEQFLGGMEFKVPIADEYASDGSLIGKGQVLILRRVNFLTKSEVITQPGDYTVHLIPQDLSEAENGTNYVNGAGNVVCPIMVNCAGNALTYNMIVDINGELGNTHAVTPQQHLTFGGGTSAYTQEFSVNEVTWFTITAPAEAKVQMFNQHSNYNVKEILVNKTEVLDDGTVKSYFATPGGQTITYRVSMENKITRAGFTSTSNKNLVVTFGDNEDPKTAKSNGLRIENSSLLNVNTQNNLKMEVGETFRLRSFRAGWQIINTDTANIMIEPDFHYNIISGAEHIELIPVTDKCTGNAGSGMNANWMDIKAVSEGTAIIEVSYDAINVSGNTSYSQRFGAVDSSRKSVVVINIGGDQENTLVVTTTAETVAPSQPGDNGTYDWDADFDTVYFLDDSGEFEFTAVMGNAVPDKMELSTDLGATWSEVSCSDGAYRATGLVAGNNLLRATKDDKVEYQVVRASKLIMTVFNYSRTGDEIIVGDKVKVTFSGIYTPIPKMSGIYNPGFNQIHRTFYTLPEGVTASSTSTQYGFAKDNQYTITFSSAGIKTFTNGYITGGVMGDPMGAHRELTDSGRGVNFNASGFFYGRSILPELTFEVIENPIIEVTVVSDPEGAEVSLTDEKGNAIEANEDGTFSLKFGTYKYHLTKEGCVPERGQFIVGGDDKITGKKTVTIAMKIIGGDIWDGSTKTEPKKNEDGVYLIGTGEELAWFASNHKRDTSAIMTADISLGGFSIMIYGFVGTFDGNGHYITDFYSDTALFKYPMTGTVIKNLGVEGVISGSGAGIALGLGNSYNFTVENCVSRMTVNGGSGIVSSGDATVVNCYNTGDVTGNGIASGATTVKNCYNIGNAKGNAIIPPAPNTNHRNNYALLGTAANIGGTGLTADELKTYASVLGDAYMDNPTGYNDGFPILKWEEPRALVFAIEEFSAEIESYKADENYSDKQAEAREKVVIKCQNAIAVATTIAEAQEALNNAKATIDAILEGQIPEDSGDPALDGAKAAAKAELAEYAAKEEHDKKTTEKIDAAVKAGNKAIDAAKTVEEVKKALSEAKKEIALIISNGIIEESFKKEVYFSVSHDAGYVKTPEDVVMAFQKITVPYFDLKEYGLEQYYFSSESYGKDEDYTGEGNPESDIEPGSAETAYGKVTMLHLFIYATEVFYCGIDPEDAGQGYLYDAELMGSEIFDPTGSTGSMYIKNFWGMDENFNYYHNYKYPLASEGWGSTADQILLHDGDIVTLGHFSCWSFHGDDLSVFNLIKEGEQTIKTEAAQGEKIDLTVYLAGKGGNYTTAHTPRDNKPSVFYIPAEELDSGNVSSWYYLGNADENGNITVDTKYMEQGEYYICISGQYGKNYPDEIVSTPGGIILTVTEAEQAKGDLNADGIIDIFDARLVISYSYGQVELNDKQIYAADVNGDGIIDVFDARMIVSYSYGQINAFP